MTGPMATNPRGIDPGWARRVTVELETWDQYNRRMLEFVREVNERNAGHVMGALERQVWNETARQREAQNVERFGLPDLSSDNSSPFSKYVMGFIPFATHQQITGAADVPAADLTYDAIARELAARVAARYIKGAGPMMRIASIAEQLFDHSQQLRRGPPESQQTENFPIRYVNDAEGHTVRWVRTIGVPDFDPDNYDLDNYQFSGWVDLYPKQRLDLLGYPISLPPYYHGLPDLWTPTVPPEEIPNNHAAIALPHWIKDGTGKLVLHPGDQYIVETWEEDYGAGPDRAVQRVLYRGTAHDPEWTGPTIDHEEVQLRFVEEEPISPGKARVGRTVKEVGPRSPSPAPARTRQEQGLRRGFQFDITTDTVVPQAVTDPVTQVAPVTEPPPPAWQKVKSRVKERKIRPHRKMAGIVWWAMNAVTESVDAVTQFWKALPPENRTGMVRRVARDGTVYYKRIFYPTPIEMARDLYRGWDRVDFNKALWNVTVNQIQDHVIGRTNAALTKHSLPHLERSGRPVGFTAGPAL